MSEVLCVTDNIIPESPFHLVCKWLDNEFDSKIVCLNKQEGYDTIKDVFELTKFNPRIVFTDSFQLTSLSKQIKTVLYVWNAKDWLQPNPFLKRQLHVRPEMDIFCASLYLARIFYNSYQVKYKIQHPYIESHSEISDPVQITYNSGNSIVDYLMSELPDEQFCHYGNVQDLFISKLYIHIPVAEEMTNTRIPMAASWGVPCITVNQWCIPEVVTRGDTLLQPHSNMKQWLQGVKIAMRDRDANSKISKNESKKFSNLDALVDRVKVAAQKRAMSKAVIAQPDRSRSLFEQRTQAASRRHKILPPKPQTITLDVSKEPYVKPTVSTTPTPTWFKEVPKDINVDVSIIVPMYRSANEIVEQIASWDMKDDGLVKEIIYVDDACPQHSSNAVFSSWEKKIPNYIGKVLTLNKNSGFATACNEGAKHSRGKYLIFLNADTTVTSNWVRPMYSLFSDTSIGIVGNLQLKNGEEIDSAGSEWLWDCKSFEHIGRNVYQGKRLKKIMTLSEAPEDLKKPAERDMVTGCCLMIPKSLFDTIGGFDIKYRIGYWEDSDINMEVKFRGYKVYYQPESVIYHKSGHSRAGLHPFIMDNAKLFYQKWVDNQKIDELVSTRRPNV